ncbi:MAG: glucosaminidase domain-containing protein [Rhodospirillales bacterium]|nr:glucosaminidase domain-containing protein [Rhodospirillales bacterium]
MITPATSPSRPARPALAVARNSRVLVLAALLVVCSASALIVSRIVVDDRMVVSVGSIKDVTALFKRLDYSRDNWSAPKPGVPRLLLSEISPSLGAALADSITVDQKKSVFLMFMAPLGLVANEHILKDRERLLELRNLARLSSDEQSWLADLAVRYRVSDDTDAPVTDDVLDALVDRVDALPLSLILAQGAEESGWGTSRFATEGNALFGQWTWGRDGITPGEQRSSLGDYKIAAFDTPLDSVEAYLLNVNSHNAYSALRDLRSKARESGDLPSGTNLAAGLSSYSERGEGYVESLRSIIRTNDLRPMDGAGLREDNPTIIVKISEDRSISR